MHVNCVVMRLEQHPTFQQLKNTLDAKRLSTAIGVLKRSHKLKAVYLRPLLINTVPNNIVLDCVYNNLEHVLHYTMQPKVMKNH